MSQQLEAYRNQSFPLFKTASSCPVRAAFVAFLKLYPDAKIGTVSTSVFAFLDGGLCPGRYRHPLRVLCAETLHCSFGSVFHASYGSAICGGDASPGLSRFYSRRPLLLDGRPERGGADWIVDSKLRDDTKQDEAQSCNSARSPFAQGRWPCVESTPKRGTGVLNLKKGRILDTSGRPAASKG